MINHRMIGVYLQEFDLHAQIELRNIEGKFIFKQESLQLIGEEQSFKLKQTINVVLDSIDQVLHLLIF